MKTMTIRNIPDDVARALEKEKRNRGTSLNETVICLMRQSLGIGGEGSRSNGLATIAGTWSAQEFQQFSRHVAPFEEVDEELWQ